MCNKQEVNNNNIEKRVEKIEKYLKSGNGMQMANVNVQSSINTNNNNTSNVNKTSDIEKSKTSNKNSHKKEDTNRKGNVDGYWQQIVNDLKQKGKIVLYTNLLGTKAVEINDMTIGIEFPKGLTQFGKSILEKQENIKEISNLVSIACGKEMQIKYIMPQQNQNTIKTKEQNVQDFANKSDIPFNIID